MEVTIGLRGATLANRRSPSRRSPSELYQPVARQGLRACPRGGCEAERRNQARRPRRKGHLTWFFAEREGFEPSNGVTPVTSLAGKRLQPGSATSPVRASVAGRRLHSELVASAERSMAARWERRLVDPRRWPNPMAHHHTNATLEPWRDGRADECTGLENQRALAGPGGSNPPPSALVMSQDICKARTPGGGRVLFIFCVVVGSRGWG